MSEREWEQLHQSMRETEGDDEYVLGLEEIIDEDFVEKQKVMLIIY